MSEITDEDRALIERHVLLPYALHYLDQEFEAVKDTTGFVIPKYIIPDIKKAVQQEQFRVRNELRKRRIKVESAYGRYRAVGDGVELENKMSGEMVKDKTVKLLMELTNFSAK